MKRKLEMERNTSPFATHDTKVSLNNWSKLIGIMSKINGTEIVENEKFIYFKVYYKNDFSVDDKNEIFVSISSLPCNKDHEFFGVTEYNDNNEMCFVFRKNLKN